MLNELQTFKFIVACSACHKQYYANSNKVGDRFTCACGQLITIPEPAPHQADVVNCSACGGARIGNKPACTFCGVDFTLHEQDMNTICPGCMTRISNRAKFCHACALAITAHQTISSSPSEKSQHLCPNCQEGKYLKPRRFKQRKLSVMECGSCAGIWLDAGAFSILEDEAKSLASSGITRHYNKKEKPKRSYQPINDKFYRPCPICSKIMHRQQYGPGSHVIVDTCPKHGLWFDNFELSDIIRWVKAGGLTAAQAKQTQALKDEIRRYESVSSPVSSGAYEAYSTSSTGLNTEFLWTMIKFFWTIIQFVIDKLKRLFR